MIAEMGEDFDIPVKGLNGWLHFDSGYPSLPKRVISEKTSEDISRVLMSNSECNLILTKDAQETRPLLHFDP